MHLLSGVYVCCTLKDTITLSARGDGDITLRYVGRDGIYPKDTAYLMAKRLQERYKTPGVDIVIEKRIPEKCGLGGSSADAAGVARAFSEEFSLGKIDGDILLSVGSDVPFQYEGGAAVVEGLGDRIKKIDLPAMHLAILCPSEGVSTAECFRFFDEIGGDGGDVEALIRSLQQKKPPVFFNALERAARTLVPDVERGKEILTAAGFYCGMTGSGSALFGMEYDEGIFREKMNKVIVPEGFTLLTAMTEANL